MVVVEEGQSSKSNNAAWKDDGLIDRLFSWSLEDILNQDLYKTQVEKIPESFDSVQHYLSSYLFPLVEETRSELCSSLEVLYRAPFAEVTSIEASKPHLYNVQLDAWRNRSNKLGQEPYRTLPGDIFVVSDSRPESVADLQCPRRTWSLAWVTKVTNNGYHSSAGDGAACIKLKTAKDIIGDGMQKPFFVVFLMNITPSNRIWRSLHLSGNVNIIKEVLCTNSVVEEICSQCSLYVNAVYAERLGSRLPSTLNEPQRAAILCSLCKINCNHKFSVELIWGPPGTGKTKTVSMLLSTILGMNRRVLTCAPTNVAITELASRVLKLIKESSQTKSERGVAFCSLGDMLLFGTKDRLKIGFDLEQVFLDYRVDRLRECFGPITGWKHCFTSMINFFQNCKLQYHAFLENELSKTEGSEKTSEGCKKRKSFLDFAREHFKSTAQPLRRCIQNLCTHLPKRFLLEHNFQQMEILVNLLDSLNSLLSQENVISEELEEIFSHPHTSIPPNLSVFTSAFLYLKNECFSVVRTLQISLDQLKLPSVVSRRTIKNFCFQKASLILCTTSSSYKLYTVKMEPLDLLVIDEAAQLKECESTIPLQLSGLRHAVLIGDEYQLPATVKSTVSEEAGFGRSLFERLSLLGHSKHLLNIQYRMQPSVSCFPNSRFYTNQILNAPNVMSASYTRRYLPGPMFGPYSFINVNDGKEELDGIGHSRKNMVEVAVVIKIIQNLYKVWKDSRMKLSIGVISPYTAQVVAIINKLGRRFEKLDGFTVKVKSVDGFQGGEEDIVVISTVRCNSGGSVGFLSNHQRVNVALTRARHCLWIVGNGKTLVKSKSVWESVVNDAKSRQCFFNADEDKGLSNAIIEVKEELLDFNDLLDKDSVLFRVAKWKVYFSCKFRGSFWKLGHITRKSIMFLLLKLSIGWRPKGYSNSISGSSQILKKFKVEKMHIVCSVDVEKDMKYMQVLKVWDILPLEDIPILVKSLECMFKMYTDDFLNHSRAICHQGEFEVPMTWGNSHDIIRYKSLSFDSESLPSSIVIDQSDFERTKEIESLLLMKFCLLSYPVASMMLSSHAGRDWDNLYQVSDQQLEIILSARSTFIIGQPGSEKNTVLITKLIQRERQHSMFSEAFKEERSNGLHVRRKNNTETSTKQKKGTALRQVFITATPKQCVTIKQQMSYLQRMTLHKQDGAESCMVDMQDIDDVVLSMDIPDSFIDITSTSYPLIITFRKFLMMLDGSVGASFFDRFHELWKFSHAKSRNSRSPALQTFIRMKEVNFDRFLSSYWPHFRNRLTKKLDAFTVFSEIIYSIKGSWQAGEITGDNFNREDYLQLYKGYMSTLSRKRRDKIYDLFLDYEKRKLENGEYDLADLVTDLHCRLRVQDYEGDEIDFVYVDEVQSLTMRQIALLKYVCRNVKDGFVFSGDRACTIARGNDFRFQDLRFLFYREFLMQARNDETDEATKLQYVSQILHLSQNFHTHAGVLRLAQSVINLIFCFFPLSIDILSHETSLLDGAYPILVEPVKGENAIITIFGNNNVGFGAQQVIMVRDDVARKEISDHVGKQALILTIRECQGLEFQDVLLYNFFGSSSLEYQWEVIDECMKENNMLDIVLPVSYTTSSSAKQNAFCWELKQLFMAITRSTRRLWICETAEHLSNPIFDYWKKLSLVQVRQLDDSFVLEMKVSSSKEEWNSLGIKLYCESYFGMSAMCFEKAKETYRESWAKAADLRAAANQLHSTNDGAAHNVLKDAAGLFGAIDKAELVAQCLMEMNEYEKAGTYYLEKFGESREEAAGDCYFMAGCYKLAAEVYARGKYISKLLYVCSSAKMKGDLLAEVDMLEKACFFKDASKLILLHVLANSLWGYGNKGWPMKQFKGKGKLLTRAKLLAKNELGDFYESVCAEASVLLNVGCNLYEMKQNLSASMTLENFKGTILSSRMILDAHLCTNTSEYMWEDQLVTDMVKHSEEKISRNEVSVDTLVYFWDFWKDKILCMLECLGCQETQDQNTNEYCEEFCLEYFGVRKHLSNQNIIYILINSGADWTEKLDKESLQRHGDVYSVEVQQFISASRSYWYSEVFSVGEMVLEKLRALHRISSKNSQSVLKQCITAVRTLEVTQFLMEPKFLESFTDDDTLRNLSDIGLQSILYLRQHDTSILSVISQTICNDAHTFLEKNALHCHEVQDNRRMIKFVRAFHSMDSKRSFLKTLDCFDDLLVLEVESGNFMEAVSIAKVKGDILMEADFLEKAGHYREAAMLLLSYCFANSLWGSGRKGWPLKPFKHKEKLLAKAKLCAKNVSDIFYEDVCTDTSILSNQATSLFELKQIHNASEKQRNSRGIIMSVWRILDVHLRSNISNYARKDELLTGVTMDSGREDELLDGLTMNFERLSIESLVYFWNLWKGNIVNVLEYLRCLETEDANDYVSYGEFCLSYLGVRKQLNDKKWVYLLLNSDFDWARKVDDKNSEVLTMDTFQFISAARSYWLSEVRSVGTRVLENLKSFYEFSLKNSLSVLCQSMTAIHLCEVVKFLQGLKFVESSSDDSMQKIVKLRLDFIEFCKQNGSLSTCMVKIQEIDEVEHVFLEKCALHYYKLQDMGKMMSFVKALRSMDLRRRFLKSLDCYDELLLLEEESGNYMEAATLARQKGDIILEVDLLKKAGQNKEAARLIIFYSLANSLWTKGSKGWPLKPFTQKELIFEAKSLAKNCSNIFYENVCIEANLLSDEESTLSEIKQCFKASRGNNNLTGEVLSARKVLDSHFDSDISQYEWEDKLVTDIVEESVAIIYQDRLSVETLVYFWNCWKENILTVVSYLKCLETQNVKGNTNCEEFCLNYLGVRKQLDGEEIYHLLNPEADWVTSCDGKFTSMDAQLFSTIAMKFWYSELLSVGAKVLETLSALRVFSIDNSLSLFSQSMTDVRIFEVAKFFTGSESYRHSAEIELVQDYVKLSTEGFFENVFSPHWTESMTENMIALRGTEVSNDVLGEIIHNIIDLESDELTYEEIGRVLMILFGHQKLPVALYESIGERFHANPPWKAVVNELKGHCLAEDRESDALWMASLLHEALKGTYDAKWRKGFDSISPDCFLYILERQIVLVLYSQSCFYATKSSTIEWLMHEDLATCSSNSSTSDNMAASSGGFLDFVARSVHKLLISKCGVMEWFNRSHIQSDESFRLLVLRFVILMCLVCANTGMHFDMLFSVLGVTHINSKLPEAFYDMLKRIKKRKNSFIHILAEALVKIGNPLVVVCQEPEEHCKKSLCADATVVRVKIIQQRKDILRVMFPKNENDVQDRVTNVKPCSPSSSHAALDQQLKIATDEVQKCRYSKKAFNTPESSKVGYDNNKTTDFKNISTAQPSQSRFQNSKNREAFGLKKVSVALDMSDSKLKSVNSQSRDSSCKKSKTKSRLEQPLMSWEPKAEGSGKKCKEVKSKVLVEDLVGEVKFAGSGLACHHPIEMREPKKVMIPKMTSKESRDSNCERRVESKGYSCSQKEETRSLPQQSRLVWQPKVECDRNNGKQIKSSDSSNSKALPNAEGSEKKQEQKGNPNWKEPRLVSEQNAADTSVAGSDSNSNQLKCKEKAGYKKKQPLMVWEPKQRD